MRRACYARAILATITVLAATVLGFPNRAEAQSRPAFTVDATTGSGYGGGGEFRDRNIGGVRLALGVRSRGTRLVSVYGEVAMEWLAIAMGHDAICEPSPRGGCKEPFPELAGPSASAGVLVRPTSRLELRSGVGGAAYRADGTRVGAVTGQVDAAAFPFRRVGIVVGKRMIVVPRYRGDRLSTSPWAFGLRLR